MSKTHMTHNLVIQKLPIKRSPKVYYIRTINSKSSDIICFSATIEIPSGSQDLGASTYMSHSQKSKDTSLDQ